MSRSGGYAVGYGRPPVGTQFQKGQSGNPSGRPKGSKGISDVIAAALSETVTVTMNGKRHKITKWQAACTQMANQAASGDAKAAKLMIELLHQSEARDDLRAHGSGVAAHDRKANDQLMLKALGETMRGLQPEAENDLSS